MACKDASIGLRRRLTGDTGITSCLVVEAQHYQASPGQNPEKLLRAVRPVLHHGHWKSGTRTSQSFHNFLRSKSSLKLRALLDQVVDTNFIGLGSSSQYIIH